MALKSVALSSHRSDLHLDSGELIALGKEWGELR